MSLMNLNEFSTTRATEQVFLSNVRGGNSIKVIWTEKDGERKIVNRRREEIEDERRVKAAEAEMKMNKLRRNKKKKKSKKGQEDNNGIDMNANLDIFDDESTDDSGASTESKVDLNKKVDMDATLDIFDD